MVCGNGACGATSSREWKKGWPLGSGGFAHLCSACGTAYENSVFCETFHLEETGWRDCSSCSKKIHCGCIVSRSLYDFLDYSGVKCKTCVISARSCLTNGIPKGYGGSRDDDDDGSNSNMVVINRMVGDNIDQGRLMQLCKIMEANECNLLPHFQTPKSNESIGQTKQHDVVHTSGECKIMEASERNLLPRFKTPESNESIGQTKQQDVVHNLGEVSREFPSLAFPKPDNSRSTSDSKSNDMHDSLLEASLSMSLGTPLSFALPSLPIEQIKTPSPSFDHQRSRPILPKPPSKPSLTLNLESNKGLIPPMRIARPPGEGRGKSQLLPRYWPRITDQELEQLAGDLNSSIVPLFEKVLSASDAGRIGRLVLPKACAEAYFPPITQSEGVPLKIQDVKGNDWTFQFRYWPNNNSRMYVLEGVTPCIQAMQLQAGDTVTFSRIDPGEKLIMGFRKSTNNGDMPESYASTLSCGIHGDSSFSENPPSGNGFSSILQINKGNKEPSLSALPLYPKNLGDGDTVLHKSESNGFRTEEDSQHQPSEKKARNIGSKSKRLLMHSEDVLELRLTWEEAQDLLRPPTAANPNIITIEGHEFEEYDEPPVFGKRTFFVSRPPGGGQEQWAQCDECSKWRKLPVEVVLPSKWSCSDNDWDSTRGLCSAPEEMSLKGLETLLRAGKDSKKRRTEKRKTALEREPNGLDALASAAVFGDNLGESGEPSIGATTTRHPRHRPGCSCIVCIQPPSGKGKHISTCTCNVCMTVRRRFKTVMLRKKKRLSDREVNRKPKDSQSRDASSPLNPPENEVDLDRVQPETSAGIIDLNSHPSHEEPDMTSTTNPIDVALTELRSYVGQNRVSGFDIYDPPPHIDLQCSLEKAGGESKRDWPNEGVAVPVDWERDTRNGGVFRDQEIA